MKKGELVARLESQELEAQRKQYARVARAGARPARRTRSREPRARRHAPRGARSEPSRPSTRPTRRSRRSRRRSPRSRPQVRYIEELIKNAEIYAPIDGVVTVKKAFVGETVAPQGFGGAGSAGRDVRRHRRPRLARDGGRHQRAEPRASLAIGQPAEVALDAYPDKPYKARLRQIVPTADRQKGSVKVKIEILDRDARILPEMSCRVVFLNPETKVDDGGEAEGDGPVGLGRRGGRQEGGPPREGRTRPSSVRSSSEPATGSAGRGRVGRRRGRGDRRRGGGSTPKWRAEQKVRVKKD